MPKKKNDEKGNVDVSLFDPRQDIGCAILLFLSQHEVKIDDNITLPPQDYIFAGDYIRTSYGIDNSWVKTVYLLLPNGINLDNYNFVKFSNGKNVTQYDIMKILIQNYKDELHKDSFLLFSKIIAELDELEVKPTPAKTNIAPVNKLSQQLPLLELVDAGIQGMKAGKTKHQNKDVVTVVDITSIEDNVRFSKQIEPFDMVIDSSVISLYEAGNTIITPQMIHRHITGGTKQSTRSKQRLEEIETSLDRQMNTNISIDCTDELKLYHKEVQTGRISGRMLPAMKMSVLIGGQWVIGYKIQDMPFLYTYANYFNQVARYPTKLLGLLSDRYSDNIARISIKFYVLNRISSIQHGNKIDSITYKAIFDNCGLSDIASIQKTRYKEFIRAYLSELRNVDWIKDFTEEKNRKIIIKT